MITIKREGVDSLSSVVYIDVENSDFYLCGPEEFLNAMIDTLKILGVEKDRIKKEQW